MSIVVAVRKNGRTVVAADSLNVFGQERVSADNSRAVKIKTVSGALVAVTGWSVYANILDDFLYAQRSPGLNDEREIFTFFLELWKALKEKYLFVNEQAHDKDTPFADLDASFLIANRFGIYKISQDASVRKFDKYYAIGSGSVYALGALHQIYDTTDDPADLARRGVESAIAFDIYCGEPIDVMEVP